MCQGPVRVPCETCLAARRGVSGYLAGRDRPPDVMRSCRLAWWSWLLAGHARVPCGARPGRLACVSGCPAARDRPPDTMPLCRLTWRVMAPCKGISACPAGCARAPAARVRLFVHSGRPRFLSLEIRGQETGGVFYRGVFEHAMGCASVSQLMDSSARSFCSARFWAGVFALSGRFSFFPMRARTAS